MSLFGTMENDTVAGMPAMLNLNGTLTSIEAGKTYCGSANNDLTNSGFTNIYYPGYDAVEYTHTELLGYVTSTTITSKSKVAAAPLNVTYNSAETIKGIWGIHELEDATCTEPKTCKHCGATDGNPLGHSFTEDPMVCDICGCFKFYANVVLGNNLDMMFAFPKDMQTDWTGCYAEFVRSSADPAKNGTTPEVMANWGEVTIDGVPCYTVTYRGFAAKEMCDTITLTVYDKDGKAISISWTDSIQAYALRMLKKATDETDPDKYLRTVIVDMLNYGAACQNALDYPAKNPSAESLATNGLTDEQKAWATSNAPTVEDAYATVRSEDGTTWAGSQLETTSSIRYYLAFQNIEDGMYASYSYVGHKGYPVSAEKLAFVTVEGEQCIVIQDLVVADARYPITVTVYKADGIVYDTWQDSIEAYAARMTKTDDVFAAFMKFADSAHAYLHSKGA